MTDRLLDRSRLVGGILTRDAGGHAWRFTTAKPADGWAEPEFDDASWKTTPRMSPGAGPGAVVGAGAVAADRTDARFATGRHVVAVRVRRRRGRLRQRRIAPAVRGATRDYQQRPLQKNELDIFREGRNSIAVYCRQPHGGRGIDLGVRWVEIDPQP